MFMANKKQKYYVVWVGIEPGIYDNWEDAQEQVVSYPGAKYKSFSSYEQAVAAFRGNDSDECRTLLEYARRPAAATNYTALPGIAPDAIAVDAACSGNPGKQLRWKQHPNQSYKKQEPKDTVTKEIHIASVADAHIAFECKTSKEVNHTE